MTCTHIVNAYIGPCGKDAVPGTRLCESHTASMNDQAIGLSILSGIKAARLKDKPAPPSNGERPMTNHTNNTGGSEERVIRILDLLVEKTRLKIPGAVIDAKRALMPLIAQATEAAEKRIARAYGGCTECYGKGYATHINGATAYADFGDELGGAASHHTDRLEMKFCICERGKQLEALLTPPPTTGEEASK